MLRFTSPQPFYLAKNVRFWKTWIKAYSRALPWIFKLSGILPAFVVYRFGDMLAWFDYKFDKKTRSIAKRNFTVILGDMLERLSNGVIKATGHRVALTPWQRYSIILFNALDGDCEVEPLPQYVSEARPARYQPVTQGTHIEEELARAQKLRDEAQG